MKEWKGTKGQCFSIKRKHPTVHGATLTDIKSHISLPNGLKKSIGTINATQKEEGIANVELVVDAFNTMNKCGIIPSELLKQRNELLEVLKTFKQYWESDFFKLVSNDGRTQAEWTSKMNKAISKCTGK